MIRSTRQMMPLLHLLLFLSGLSLVAMGTWVTAGGDPFLHLLGPFSNQLLRFVNVGLLCIAMGTTLVLLGALGGCAAHWESKCLLLTAEGILKAWAVPALQNDYGSDPTVTGIWNATMAELKCCGFSNYTDLLGSEVEQQNGISLPPSCCSTNIAPCSPAEAARSPVQGCFDPILKTLRKHTCTVGGVAAGLGLLEIAAMIVSMYLFSHLDEKVS
ncbi:tetraspanin-1 isoform X2 [Gambusia affinis]|uniref:tetraspanin-1 isoform X2 n=1 Tax=Gambusia affinis TaxID=33528 RepID=UPI001CDD66AC|nr:tetraspanin-1 isoform X2 [Gambusia affinis]